MTYCGFNLKMECPSKLTFFGGGHDDKSYSFQVFFPWNKWTTKPGNCGNLNDSLIPAVLFGGAVRVNESLTMVIKLKQNSENYPFVTKYIWIISNDVTDVTPKKRPSFRNKLIATLSSTCLEAKLGLQPKILVFQNSKLMFSECSEEGSLTFWLFHGLLGLEKCCSAPV